MQNHFHLPIIDSCCLTLFFASGKSRWKHNKPVVCKEIHQRHEMDWAKIENRTPRNVNIHRAPLSIQLTVDWGRIKQMTNKKQKKTIHEQQK